MKSPKNRLHSVMVVGATPAGVAATNKLGELGIPVTLVDSESDLNAKLGVETYRLSSGVPLNFAHRPGLIRILRNPGIRTLMPAAVVSAKHNQQGFAVKIEQQQTFVDPELCTLCGQCTDVCPVSDSEGQKPIQINNRFSLPGRAVIDKRQEPLCQAGCPLGVNAQGYIALAQAGKYARALDLIRQDNVLPGICGRVCHHPCENECRRSDVDAPLAIRDIKRFLADVERRQSADRSPKSAVTRPEKVAVIGSGPAGLAAAADLARQGFSVTIFEKQAEAGGLLRYGIGSYRLPRKILDYELQYIQDMGVEIRTGHPIDLSHGLSDLKKKYQAVILATGAWADRKLGVPGEDLQGVEGCISYLQEIYQGRTKSLSGQAAVIGDGNAAFDLARALHRLGASVTILSWFPKEMIPADREEIEAAEAEGITIRTDCQVVAFSGESGRLKGMRLKPTQPGTPDANGIPWPVIDPLGEAFELAFDHAFVAIGQTGAYEAGSTSIGVTDHGYLSADEAGRTLEKSVYAAGDAATGATSVVQAMANGRQIAACVMQDFSVESDIPLKLAQLAVRPTCRDFEPVDSEMAPQKRTSMPEIPVDGRKSNFSEVCQGYDESQMRSEVGRCLQCGSCSQCLECINACDSIKAVRHDEPAMEISENVGVMIIADPDISPRVKGEDVIRAYGPRSAKPDVHSMMLRGFAAAAKAMMLLKDTGARPRGRGIFMAPPDPGLASQIRMGVFVCRCNDSLGWTAEMDSYLESLNKRSDIVCAEVLEAACIPQGIDHIINTIREKGLTRVVLASCVCCPLNFVCSACTDQRSRLKDGLFSGTGISRAMVQTCNLRGEVLRLVDNDPREAMDRFAGLIERSIKRATKLLPFPAPARTYNLATAVIGHTEAAENSALSLADTGLEVYLLGSEKSPLKNPPEHPNIHTLKDETVAAISGTIGNFKVFLRNGDTERVFTVGGIILGDKVRNTPPYRQHGDQPDYFIHGGMQKKDSPGMPFMYPGTTSISGLFLADPFGIQISKRIKGAAAAALAAAAMPSGPRQTRGFSVMVKENLCRSCGRCLQACPYHAIDLKPNDVGGYVAVVEDSLCKGCGNCISVCPSDAADSPFRDQAYLEKTVEELLVDRKIATQA